MFDIGASELLVILIVAILVIGPKDMPRAMRTAGRWIGKMRRMSNHFRAGMDEMVRQAEIEEMEEQWARRNREIMAKHPDGSTPEGGAPDNLLPAEMEPLSSARDGPDVDAVADTDADTDADAAAEAAIRRAAPAKSAADPAEPTLQFDPPPKDERR